jgi:hypothetical protein
MRPSVKKEDRRSNEHDAGCAIVLANTEKLLLLTLRSVPRYGGGWLMGDNIETGQGPWTAEGRMEEPKFWPSAATWPWVVWGERLVGLKTYKSKETVEAPIYTTPNYRAQPRSIGFIDVLIEGVADFFWEASVLRAVNVSGQWSVVEEAFQYKITKTIEIIVEVKSCNEKFSAGDVIRQLKTYSTHRLPVSDADNVLLVVCSQEPSAIEGATGDLLRREGILPLSLEHLRTYKTETA